VNVTDRSCQLLWRGDSCLSSLRRCRRVHWRCWGRMLLAVLYSCILY